MLPKSILMVSQLEIIVKKTTRPVTIVGSANHLIKWKVR